MPDFRRFLSRRWLPAFLGIAALLFGLAMLHPYPRQSLFGPTIRGKPWCAWENEVRRYVHREEYAKKLLPKTLRWFGIQAENMDGETLFDHVEMFPLLLALTEDPDRDVRCCALQCIVMYDKLRDPTAIPVLRRRLDDGDSYCRIRAASAIWIIDRKEPVLKVLLREIDEQPNGNREVAISHLATWSRKDPALFPHLARYAAHPDADFRRFVMLCLQGQGDRALPVLRKGMADEAASVRRMAINSLSIAENAKEAVAELIRRLKDEDKEVRDLAREAIWAIDKDIYKRLKAERKIE